MRRPSGGSVIPLSVPEIQGNEWKYVKECLDTGWVSSAGPFVSRFERELAAYAGAAEAVAVVSGTAGLHVALRAVGVEPGDEVLVSGLTFVAPVNAILYCQASPVLMDADPRTWQIDCDKVAEFLDRECDRRGDATYNRRTGRRVRAIVAVHILGLACRMDRIVELARRYGLGVVEDAAEALGVRYQGRHVGTFGNIGVFSFNGNKIATAGGGGMLVTDNGRYAEHARYLTTQAKDDELEYVHGEVGYNYRLSNVQAAIGVAQLERIDEFVERKRAIAAAYHEAFSGLAGVTPMPVPPQTAATWWLYTILLPERTSLEERKAFIRGLHADGIHARPLWHPVHELAPYRGYQAYRIEHAPVLYRRAVSLPSSVGLQETDLARCIAAVRARLGA